MCSRTLHHKVFDFIRVRDAIHADSHKPRMLPTTLSRIVLVYQQVPVTLAHMPVEKSHLLDTTVNPPDADAISSWCQIRRDGWIATHGTVQSFMKGNVVIGRLQVDLVEIDLFDLRHLESLDL